MKRSLQRIVGHVHRGVLAALAGLTLLASTISFTSCQETAMKPAEAIVRIKIVAPETYVETDFDGEGNVIYSVYGEDKEEPIDYIKTQVNEEEPQNYPNESEIPTPLNVGWNYFEASAVTSGGVEDKTPATKSVYSYSETEARNVIRNYLNQRSSTYDEFSEDVKMSLGASDDFYVDFLVKKLDGTDAGINYISSGDDLTADKENRELMNDYGIKNYSWIRTPEEVGKIGLEEFVNGGFN